MQQTRCLIRRHPRERQRPIPVATPADAFAQIQVASTPLPPTTHARINRECRYGLLVQLLSHRQVAWLSEPTTLCSPGCADHVASASTSVGCCRFMWRVTCQVRAAEYAAPTSTPQARPDTHSWCTVAHTGGTGGGESACWLARRYCTLTAPGNRAGKRPLARVFTHVRCEMRRLR